MRHHKKTFENVYSEDVPKSSSRLKWENLAADGMELDEYISLFKGFLTDWYKDLFFQCVKLSWLRRRFVFCGKKTILPMYKNSLAANLAFLKLVRRYMGRDLQIITKTTVFQKLELYFDEFFPLFEEKNPFEDPDYYKFPYKNISIDFMMVVYRLDDRLELLKEADKKDMSFAVFLDYVINHVFSENELLGRCRYTLIPTSRTLLYIHDSDKATISIKNKKRTC